LKNDSEVYPPFREERRGVMIQDEACNGRWRGLEWTEDHKENIRGEDQRETRVVEKVQDEMSTKSETAR
jgi:hypothetical protein